MNFKENECPFKVGDRVVYRPSRRGMSLDIMSSDSQKLTPGDEYKIESIQKGTYIVVEGYDHPGGGLYWAEFKEG